MAGVFARLMLLLAVLLMPLGMAAPATAAPAHHGPAANIAMEHCPEEGSKEDADGGFDQCTMACAAALPAVDAPPAHALFLADVPSDLSAGDRLSNLAPDTATPPPKLA